MLDTKENFEKMLVKLYKRAEELGITEEELEDDEELERTMKFETESRLQ